MEITLNHIQEMQQILESLKNKLLGSESIKGDDDQFMQDICILHDTICALGNKHNNSSVNDIKEKDEERDKIIFQRQRSTLQVIKDSMLAMVYQNSGPHEETLLLTSENIVREIDANNTLPAALFGPKWLWLSDLHMIEKHPRLGLFNAITYLSSFVSFFSLFGVLPPLFSFFYSLHLPILIVQSYFSFNWTLVKLIIVRFEAWFILANIIFYCISMMILLQNDARMSFFIFGLIYYSTQVFNDAFTEEAQRKGTVVGYSLLFMILSLQYVGLVLNWYKLDLENTPSFYIGEVHWKTITFASSCLQAIIILTGKFLVNAIRNPDLMVILTNRSKLIITTKPKSKVIMAGNELQFEK